MKITKYLSLILLAFSGCATMSAAQNTTFSSSIENIDDQALIAKMNPHVKVINRYSSRISDSYKRYLKWADKDSGPTGKEKIIYGLYTLYDTKTATENAEKSATLTPAMPDLDNAGKDYAEAIVELNGIINEAHEYYDQKDYLDDDMAKGKELHPKLMTAFDRTLNADKTLRARLQDIENTLTKRELEVLAKDESKKPVYLLKRFMLEAKHVMDIGGSTTEKIDKESFAEAVDTLNNTISEWKEYSESDGGKEIAANYKSIDKFLSSTVKNFQKTSKALNRRLKNNTPYTTGEKMNVGTQGGWMVEGSPDKLLNTYNTMIGNFNNLRY